MNAEQQQQIAALGWSADVMGLIQLHRSAMCGNSCKFENRLGGLIKLEVPAGMRTSLLQILEKHAVLPCTLFNKASRNLRPILETLKRRSPPEKPRDRTALEWVTFLKKADVSRFYEMDSSDRDRAIPVEEFLRIADGP